jgi:hypothetical protein
MGRIWPRITPRRSSIVIEWRSCGHTGTVYGRLRPNWGLEWELQ